MYRVLIADDEPSIPEGMKQIINWEDFGLEVCGVAYNGSQALEMVRNFGADILITDIQMPKMNGLELIKSIKELELDTRFIVLSGYDDFQYLKESIKLGIENYLIKPVNTEELSSTLINTLDKIRSQPKQKIYSQSDIEIIRSNILYRWVTDSISEAELKERSLLLDINIDRTPFAACLLRLHCPKSDVVNKTKDILSAAEKICCDTISQKDLGMVFSTPFGDIAFIINCNGCSEDYSILSTALSECMTGIKDSLQVDSFITVGGFENEINQFPRSFKRALELQQYSIIMPLNSIRYYGEKTSLKTKAQVEGIISFEEINSLVVTRNAASLATYLDSAFDRLKEAAGITPAFVQNTALEILFFILNSARSVLDGIDLSETIECRLSDIYNMQHIDEIREFVKEMSEITVAVLVNRYNNMNPIVKRVVDYVRLNYSEDICLKTLAIELNINPNYLGQLFKDETGEFFNDYINKIRVNKAKELLLRTKSSTKEISSAVGYTDPNYFYRIFKKYTCVSPTEFRASKV